MAKNKVTTTRGGSAEQTGGGAGGTKQGAGIPNLGDGRGKKGANRKHNPNP
jgi:hypothetical protein